MPSPGRRSRVFFLGFDVYWFGIGGGVTEATIRHFLSRFRLHFSRKAITLLEVD